MLKPTLAECFVDDEPVHLIGDTFYDNDSFDVQLADVGIELIAPHRRNRKKPQTQDRSLLRRYKH